MCTKERKPRPHAEIIKAWADGAIIQYKDGASKWHNVWDNRPKWDPSVEYRVKPEPKKAKVLVRFWKTEKSHAIVVEQESSEPHAKNRQAVVERWARFGGWLTDWECREFTVEGG